MPPAEPESSKHEGAITRVIIADDHAVVRTGARCIIAGHPSIVFVAEAASPEQMMEALALHACDVLIADFTMPGRQPDGVPMLAAVRRKHPSLEVVLFTVSANARLLELALASGVKGVVSKTAAMDELLQAVLAVADGRSYIGESLRAEIGTMVPRKRKGHITQLSSRELDVLRLLAANWTVSQIAAHTNRSVATISRQKITAMKKLGISTNSELHVFLSSGAFML